MGILGLAEDRKAASRQNWILKANDEGFSLLTCGHAGRGWVNDLDPAMKMHHPKRGEDGFLALGEKATPQRHVLSTRTRPAKLRDPVRFFHQTIRAEMRTDGLPGPSEGFRRQLGRRKGQTL